MKLAIPILGLLFLSACGGHGYYLGDTVDTRQRRQSSFYQARNDESYSPISENEFHDPLVSPLSTFAIDVDAASYSNVRRYINDNSLPPADAVRIEELINYFNYDYPFPESNSPFSIITEVSNCPWNPDNRLVHLGIQGRVIPNESLPTSNIVFLIDVSGSMNQPQKLPLLKSAFKLFVSQLRENDHVAIVVYAGAAGLVLPPTPGSKKQVILSTIDRLQAGGSTAGAEGLELAYSVASENFDKKGNNRIILATDGDFNVGMSSDAAMEALITEKRESGVFLTVLGFGAGNLKDSKMEVLADKGNGNYSYIDNILEAKKVFVNELGATLHTIAKDVKIQVEFNPAHVASYRLVGYENRMLRDTEFEDDNKDGGEIGAGHSVTALYEIVPSIITSSVLSGKLRYQYGNVKPESFDNPEMMTISFRYKMPQSEQSRLITVPVLDQGYPLDKTTDNFRFSAAVAEFGMLLRDSKFKGQATFETALSLARGAVGADKSGYRAEFIRLVETGGLLAENLASN